MLSGLAVCAVVALALSGCFFGDSLDIFAADLGEDGVSLIISASASTLFCDNEEELNEFECTYFSGEESTAISSFSLSSIELLLFLIVLDPLVLQLPDGVAVTSATSTEGPLAVTGPFASLPIDLDRSLTADAGAALWVVAFPEGATPTGSIGYNIAFSVPPGVSSVPVKPLFTAHARTMDGTDYYPPILPCVDDMADAIALDLPVPAPGSGAQLNLPPLGLVPGCAGEIYDFGGVLAPPADIPVLGGWLLVALAAALGGAGLTVLRLRQG